MKSLTKLKSGLLEWRREEGTALAFRLTGEDELVATLDFPDALNTLAKLETAEGSWTLKRLGLLKPITTLRVAGEKWNTAVFRHHALRHDKLEFSDGAMFDWVSFQGHEAGGLSWTSRANPWSASTSFQPPFRPAAKIWVLVWSSSDCPK